MLELRNITKTFGAVTANNDVSITVHKGTIHAIVGENGAGKSTIMRIAYGFYNADSGEIYVDGNKVDIRGPHDAIALGIGMVHQHFMLVDTMTVAENIILGSETGSAANLDLEKANREIRALSDELKLEINPNALIEDLSVGQQQRVELLKALYRNAELLILDEPTAVLSPQEVEEFFAILRRMKAQGKTIIIITHKLEEVLAISDEVTVMRDGKVVGNVKTSETNAKELARMIVGRDVLLRVEKPDASKMVIGAPPLRPASSASHVVATSLPTGVTRPTPVTATRRRPLPARAFVALVMSCPSPGFRRAPSPRSSLRPRRSAGTSPCPCRPGALARSAPASGPAA